MTHSFPDVVAQRLRVHETLSFDISIICKLSEKEFEMEELFSEVIVIK